jgi:hypothetical protein
VEKRYVWLLCLIVLLSAGRVAAQSTNAAITGRVTDPEKAVIAGARVSAINTETSLRYEGTSNNTGSYVISNLPPGPYRVEVERPGFKTVVETGVVLHVQDAVELNYEMALGAVSESVTVTADRNNINTTDGTVSTVVDQTFVADIPLNGRSLQSLFTLAPGVIENLSVNGQRADSNYFSVDGVSSNTGLNPQCRGCDDSAGSVAAVTALGTTQSLVPIDDLQEFRVQTSTYSAEYGRNPGGQFGFVTRSGTDQWHGSLFEYLRKDVFDANNWFNRYYANLYGPQDAANFQKGQERQNDFGGTVGGGVNMPGNGPASGKTFFFLSYEGLRLFQPETVQPTYVPSLSLRQSAPAALQPFLNSWPIPNGPDQTGDLTGYALWSSTVSYPSTLNSWSVRLDHNWTPGWSTFARYSDSGSNSAIYAIPSWQGQDLSTRTLTIGNTNLVASTLTNDLRFNYSWINGHYYGNPASIGGATPVPIGDFVSGSDSGGVGLLGAIFYLGLGPTNIATGFQDTATTQRQLNIVDTVSFTNGRHVWKMGVDARRLHPNIVGSRSAYWEYLSLQSVMDNTPDYAFLSIDTTPSAHLLGLSLFAQDEWRVSSRFTLSSGLRWELDPPPSGPLYTFTSLDPTTATLAPLGTPVYHTTYYNFAPRIGAAYQLRTTPGMETVLRGGFGVFYDTGNQTSLLSVDGDGYTGTSNISNGPPSPNSGFSSLSPSTAPPYFYDWVLSPHLQLPYTLQWSVVGQQGLGKHQSLSVAYVANVGRRLLYQQSLSTALNPNFYSFGSLFTTSNGGRSNYESFQTQFQRRLSRGLQVLASYTFAHSIDDIASTINPGASDLVRGNSDFDIRHNFQLASTWDLPKPGGTDILRSVFGFWSLDTRFAARSALPVDIFAGQVTTPSGQTFNQRPDVVPGVPFYLSDPAAPGGRIINANAFSTPPSNISGDAPRNFLRGFGMWQLDFAVKHDFPIYDRLHLEFKAEAFNLFNHTNFGGINNSLGGPNFGEAAYTLNQYVGQAATGGQIPLNPLYQVGGPRSLQFSLRLQF